MPMPVVGPFLTLAIVAGLATAAIILARSRRRLALELVATRRLFTECMNLAPFCVYVKGLDGRYLYANHTFHHLVRKDLPHVTSFLGRTDRELFPAEQAQVYIDDDRKVIREQSPLAFDNSSIAPDGTVRQWFSVKFPWIDELGRSCVAGISIDMSEVQRARETAKVSADRCALALEAGRMGTLTMDLNTQMLDTSPLFAVLHGRPETKTRLSLEESLAEVHPDDRPLIVDTVKAALRDRAPNRITYRVVHPDGVASWIELVGKVYVDDAGRPTIVRGVGFDVTDRQTAYEELSSRKAVLRRLIEVQENERQTLCHELHDGMMQYAIGAKMLLESTLNPVEPDDSVESTRQPERIHAAIDLLTRGIEEGRRVIRGVRSAVLDDLGLAAAIQDLADQMGTFGIAVDLALDDDIDELAPALQTTVYRVVQESLSNVRKHSGADRATVAVQHTPSEVRVQITDEGRGFDVGEGRRRGFGLVGMTERVRLAGGTCTITSQPDVGSRVDARLPPAAAEEGRVALLRPTARAAAADDRHQKPEPRDEDPRDCPSGRDEPVSSPAGLRLGHP